MWSQKVVNQIWHSQEEIILNCSPWKCICSRSYKTHHDSCIDNERNTSEGPRRGHTWFGRSRKWQTGRKVRSHWLPREDWLESQEKWGVRTPGSEAGPAVRAAPSRLSPRPSRGPWLRRLLRGAESGPAPWQSLQEYFWAVVSFGRALLNLGRLPTYTSVRRFTSIASNKVVQV